MDGSIELTMLHRRAVNVHARDQAATGASERRARRGDRKIEAKAWNAINGERKREGRTYACVRARTDETTYVLNFPPCKSRHESVYTHGIAASINACVCSRLGGAAGSLSGA